VIWPAGLARSLTLEWRLIALRWVGIVFVAPALPLLHLSLTRLDIAYAILGGAAPPASGSRRQGGINMSSAQIATSMLFAGTHSRLDLLSPQAVARWDSVRTDVP
jgi:hypothetical protein